MSVKNLFKLTAAALALCAAPARAADSFTLQLKWVTQAQFAGYYVALEKGFYEDEGLEMDVKPGGPDIAPPQILAGGGADVIVEWMPAALAAREGGLPLVNVAQIFDRSGMMLSCLKSSGIGSPGDFPGKTLGVWFFGNEYPFLSWMNRLELSTEGGTGGVTVLKQGFNVDPDSAGAGGLHFHHDLQRILADYRRGRFRRRFERVQVRGAGRGHLGGRALCA